MSLPLILWKEEITDCWNGFEFVFVIVSNNWKPFSSSDNIEDLPALTMNKRNIKMPRTLHYYTKQKIFHNNFSYTFIVIFYLHVFTLMCLVVR